MKEFPEYKHITTLKENVAHHILPYSMVLNNSFDET